MPPEGTLQQVKLGAQKADLGADVFVGISLGRTSPNGYTLIEGLLPGSQTVTVSHANYEPQSFPVQILSGDTVRSNVVLVRRNVQALSATATADQHLKADI